MGETRAAAGSVRRNRKGLPHPTHAASLTTAVLLCRSVAVVLLASLWLFQQEADDHLERGWQLLRATWLFQHESFEVCLVAVLL